MLRILITWKHNRVKKSFKVNIKNASLDKANYSQCLSYRKTPSNSIIMASLTSL